MKKYLSFLLFFMVVIPVCADDMKLILHDKCINALYMPASAYFMYDGIYVIRDSRGIILRFNLKSPSDEYLSITTGTLEKLQKIKSFLAKIKNPVIIEVHIQEKFYNNAVNLKNWEISAVIAGNIEKTMIIEVIVGNINEDLEKYD